MTSSIPLALIELAGSRRTMGESFGEQLRSQVRELYAIRLRSALLQAHEHGRRDATESALLQVARASFRITADFDPETADEIEGIARGSGLSVEQTMAMNGLTDLRDALSWWEGSADLFGGCTAIVAQCDRPHGSELLAGQTWDLGTDNKPFVLAVRRTPTSGLRSVCLTTAGCLPFLGVNEAGVAVGTTNLRTRDARPGVVYVTLIDRALRARNVEDALRSIGPSPRAGGHFFYVVDASGGAAAIECTARRHHTTSIVSSVFVHTNHCLVSDHQPLDVDEANASSHVRLRRMTLLAETSRRPLDPETLKSFFGDTSAGPLAICRDDIEGTSTNAAAILRPKKRTLLACHGLPTHATWVELAT
jgi:isopenicillin-N N-acyltransferase like protein